MARLTQIPVMTEEEFLAAAGLSKFGFGECALHKNRGKLSDKSWNKIVKNQLKKDTELAEKREAKRQEYQRLTETGLIRKPTRIERLEAVAAGHPDNESTKAAKRLLEKYKNKEE